MWRFLFAAIVSLLIAFQSGCGTITVTPTPQTENWPVTNKSPVHAGVYYSSQFANQTDMRAGGSIRFSAPIGAASVALFDALYPRVFEKTSRVPNLSERELSTQGIDVVVTPSLEYFSFRLGLDPDSDIYSVAYRTTLSTMQGVPVASWTVIGNAPTNPFGSVWSWIEADINDAAVKFLQSFEREADPALAAIAKDRGNPPLPLDVHDLVLTAHPTHLPAFDSKVVSQLEEAGVVALRVTAQSKNQDGLVVRASDMRLRLGKRTVIEPSPTSALLSILESPHASAGELAAVLFGAPIGALVGHSEARSAQIVRELQSKVGSESLFGDRILRKGVQDSGIVMFRLGEGGKLAAGSSLTAWVVDPVSARGVQIELPLSVTK